MSNAIIQTERLTHRYGRVVALADVDLVVPAGAVYALLGPNGAGKTTLLQLLMHLRRATAGRVMLLGKDTARLTLNERASIGYLAESQTLPGWMRLHQLEAYLAPLYDTWDFALANDLRRRFRTAPDPGSRVGAAHHRIDRAHVRQFIGQRCGDRRVLQDSPREKIALERVQIRHARSGGALNGLDRDVTFGTDDIHMLVSGQLRAACKRCGGMAKIRQCRSRPRVIARRDRSDACIPPTLHRRYHLLDGDPGRPQGRSNARPSCPKPEPLLMSIAAVGRRFKD